jgi:hypothetical protein
MANQKGSSGTQGGTPQQHAEAGRQSHKNDGNQRAVDRAERAAERRSNTLKPAVKATRTTIASPVPAVPAVRAVPVVPVAVQARAAARPSSMRKPVAKATRTTTRSKVGFLASTAGSACGASI